MKSILLTALSAFVLSTSVSIAQVDQETPHPSSTQESSSDNDSREMIGKGINLVSFTVGRFQDERQFLEVPIASPNNSPKVTVQHPDTGYQWNVKNLQANGRSGFLQAKAPDDKVRKLQTLKLQPSQLFARAEINSKDEGTFYVPVILNRSTARYEFVFYCSQCTASVKTAKMITASQGPQNCSITSSRNLTRVTCNENQLRKGKFRLFLSGELKMSGVQSRELLSAPYNFRHDPRWLE